MPRTSTPASSEFREAFLAINEAVGELRSSTERRVLRDVLREHDPGLPLAQAAELLKVSIPTVRAWIERGLLEDLHARPRRVSVSSVAALGPQLEALREEFADPEQAARFLRRLDDAELLARKDVREGMRQAERSERAPFPERTR
jgi:hypothetical protein